MALGPLPIPIGLMPAWIGLGDDLYLYGTFTISSIFFLTILAMGVHLSDIPARLVFRVSLSFLPSAMILMLARRA